MMPTTDFVLPGLVNAHSHAFQRAMAGLAERQTHPGDSFWTWREQMYRYAGLIEPGDLQAIAAQLYVEMLKAGYTTVCEFHYLHHQRDGHPYADVAAMSRALMAAAEEAGIGLCLLPVLYMQGGFDGRALAAHQQRFGHEVDAFLGLIEILRRDESDAMQVGIALHSLRAVSPLAMAAVLAAEAGTDRPIHIHIAEQIAEVEECLLLRGTRPVSWLLEHVAVDARWTLVHATQLSAPEVQAIADTNATVCLCPTTEANLGDGLFPLPGYIAANGRFSIGSDSHISVSPVEELRWLEYGQRLQVRGRNIAVDAEEKSVGRFLFDRALAGGRYSAGARIAGNTSTVTLNAAHPLLAARTQEQLLDTWIFSGNVPLIREVVVGGRSIVCAGMHVDEERIARRYVDTVQRLARS
ncbi:MAG TPA: formimidoylglutamate deiminase [Pseudomonadota bacterium]|nr:formimidoylglutamate deiminase [Rhodanobacteraceae bacterium]MBP9155450.1 formimidoylglutamate deiminase [Xanthomonadales bacterium]HQW80413.1 formimidoylglutamate deiminase [Pseudomonadota bacterium]